MSLNITIDGFCYRDNSSLSNLNVKYQMFFYQNGTASSSSAWNDVRIVENTGYFNANLGDGDWLGQDGTALSNSKVVLVFWAGSPLGDDRNADCSILTEWGATEFTIDGSSTYTLDTQTKVNYTPDLFWSLQASGYVDTNYTTTNSSEDIHPWIFGTTSMYHWYTRYGQTINWVNQVDNTSYWWGDGDDDLALAGVATGTHQWDLAGYYDVDIVIEDKCSATASGTDQIQIFYHPPTGDITMTPADPDPNEVVTFQWTGTDVDDRITSIDWIIYDDTNTTTSGVKDAVIPHSEGEGTAWCSQSENIGAFTDPGSHLVEIVIHWNDGFTNQTLDYDDTFTQGVFTGPTVSFTQVPTEAVMASGVKFVNTSTNTSRVGLGLADCAKYDWTWTDDGSSIIELDNPYSYEFEQVPTSVNCSVELCANWSDGFDTQQTCATENVPFATTVIVTDRDCYNHLEVYGTSGDGTITGYGWTISSGTSALGPWTEVWTSPIGIDQQEKDINFCTVSWYHVEGFVYGSGATTSDYEVLYVDEVCTASGVGETVVVAICEPDMTSDEQGNRYMYGDELTPSMKSTIEPRSPSIQSDVVDLVPFPKPRYF